MTRVLVTGGSGYIGTTLVEKLQAEGLEVVNVDNGYFAEANLGPVSQADVTVAHDTRLALDPAVFNGVDAVFHLAALSNDPMGDLNADLTLDVNVKGTELIARAAKDAGVRMFLFASSCSVYGSGDGDSVLSEESPIAPITAYAKSKADSEKVLEELASDDFKVVSLRAATVFGFSNRPRFDLVINELSAQSFAKGELTLSSLGTSWRPFVHVEDLVAAYIEIYKSREILPAFDAFNVGSKGTTFRIIDVAEAIAAATNGTLVIKDGAQADTRNYRVEFAKFEDTFKNWNSQWDLENGVRDLVENFEKFGLTVDDVDGFKFRRLPYLQELQRGNIIDENLRVIK